MAQAQRLIIRHLSGSKVNQVEEFPIQHVHEIVCGREPGVTVLYDPDKDDLVSRQHLRITPNPADPEAFDITDLGSRNGTFVNSRRIYGTARLSHGDIVQMGPGGPEFRFEMDPPPAGSGPHPTRLAMDPLASAAGARTTPPTRDASAPAFVMGMTPPGMPPPTSTPNDTRPRPVGRATVERMLGDVVRHMKGDSNKAMTLGLASLAAILLVGAGVYWYMRVVNAQTHQLAVASAGQAQQVEGLRTDLTKGLDKAGSDAKTAADRAANAAATKTAGDTKSEFATLIAKLNPFSKPEPLKPAPPEVVGPPPVPTPVPPPTTVTSTAPVTSPEEAKDTSAPLGPSLLSTDQIHADNVDAVVYIESGWKLIDTATGRQVYHYYAPNEYTEIEHHFLGSTVKTLKRFPGIAAAYVPVYMRSGDSYVPVLTNTDDGGKNKPVGGLQVGSGFVVTEEGHILTCRDIVSTWDSAYVWSASDAPGLVVEPDGSFSGTIDSTAQLPHDWVPAGETSSFWESISYDQKSKRLLTTSAKATRPLEGRLDYLNVVFPKTRQRTHAQLVRSSDQHDAALIKVSLGEKLQKVDINDNYSSIRQGERVATIGYLATGADTPSGTAGQNTGGRVTPDPTDADGIVAKIYRDSGPIEGVDYLSGEFGDSYRLGVTQAGYGFSGGPVFDGHGRVIALFYAGRARNNVVNFAVPIRYGKALIGR